MKTITVEKIQRITKNHKRLMKALNVKITNKGKEVSIEGTPENEYTAIKVIDALNFGFSFSSAISIKEEDNLFEIINIKAHAKQKNFERIRGRIIGKSGRALATLALLTKCHLELKENQVGIIGDAEHIEMAIEAIILIIQGGKHANIYKGLEKNQPKMIYDLGLRENDKKV